MSAGASNAMELSARPRQHTFLDLVAEAFLAVCGSVVRGGVDGQGANLALRGGRRDMEGALKRLGRQEPLERQHPVVVARLAQQVDLVLGEPHFSQQGVIPRIERRGTGSRVASVTLAWAYRPTRLLHDAHRVRAVEAHAKAARATIGLVVTIEQEEDRRLARLEPDDAVLLIADVARHYARLSATDAVRLEPRVLKRLSRDLGDRDGQVRQNVSLGYEAPLVAGESLCVGDVERAHMPCRMGRGGRRSRP